MMVLPSARGAFRFAANVGPRGLGPLTLKTFDSCLRRHCEIRNAEEPKSRRARWESLAMRICSGRLPISRLPATGN